jgi:hypothetical protein
MRADEQLLEGSRMRKRTWTCLSCLAVLLPALLAGCGGEDRAAEQGKSKSLDGTFLGKVSGTNALVAVVAAPPTGKEKQQDVTIYLSDGSKLSEWLAGAVERNSFAAATDDRDAQVKGELNGNSVKGTITLPDGKTVRYEASRAGGAAGLYDLTVSAKGKISGASATGIGLTGKTALGADGSGTLKLADGTRHKFDVTGNASGSELPVRSGQLRVIVLGDGELRGAGRARGSDDDEGFFIRSS